MDDNMCKSWENNKKISPNKPVNPKTNRTVQKNGKTYNKIEKECSNPVVRRARKQPAAKKPVEKSKTKTNRKGFASKGVSSKPKVASKGVSSKPKVASKGVSSKPKVTKSKDSKIPPYSILKMDKMIKQMLSENEVKDKVFILDGQLYTQTRNVNGNLFIRLMPFDEVGEWMNKNIEGWFVFNTGVYLLFYKVSQMEEFFITYGSDLVDIYDEEEYAGIDKVVKFVTKHDQDKFFKELDHEITGM